MTRATRAHAPERRDCLAETDVDRLVLAAGDACGDGDVAASGSYAPHLATCAACRERVTRALAARDAVLRDVVPRTLPAVARRIDAGGSAGLFARAAATLRARWPLAAAGLAAAMLLLTIASPALRPDAGVPAADDVRLKGDAAVRLVAVRAGRAFTPDAAHPVRPGDAVRFIATAPHHPFATVFSVADPAAPKPALRGGDASLRPLAAGGAPLEGSFVLDAAPGPERFIVVLAGAALDDATARRIARETAGRGGRDGDGAWIALSLSVPKETP
jgi:hypothetical protein